MNMHNPTPAPATPATPATSNQPKPFAVQKSCSMVMSVGPDLLTVLEHNGKAAARNKHHFKAYSVALDTDGNPAPYLRIQEAVDVGFSSPSSYNSLLRGRVYPLADRLLAHLASLPAYSVPRAMENLLKNARRDPVLYWAMGHDKVRRFLFPNAYDQYGSRSDDLFYPASRVEGAGDTVPLADLQPATVAAFVADVRRKIARCPEDLTPFTPIQVQGSAK